MASVSSSLSTQATQGDSQTSTEIWAKLISFGPGIENVSLSKALYTLGRNTTNDIKIPDIKLSGQHCKISKDEEGNFWVEDTSSNGTFIENELIGKGKKKKVNSGDKIFLLHQSKVKQNEVIGYVFSAVVSDNADTLKKLREDNLKSLEEEKKISEKQSKFQQELGEEMMCCICIDYIYNCVTTIPCLHNFCASCFSGWMEKATACPQCREEVTEVKKNPTVNNILEKFMDNNPSKKRPKEEYEEMDRTNKIKEDRVSLKNAKANTAPVTGLLFQSAPSVSTTGSLFSNRVNTTSYQNTGTSARGRGRGRGRGRAQPSYARNYGYNYRRGYYEGSEGSFNSDDYTPSEESASDSEEEEDEDYY